MTNLPVQECLCRSVDECLDDPLLLLHHGGGIIRHVPTHQAQHRVEHGEVVRLQVGVQHALQDQVRLHLPSPDNGALTHFAKSGLHGVSIMVLLW